MILSLISCFLLVTGAQHSEKSSLELKLSPIPNQVTRKSGFFSFGNNTVIVSQVGNSSDQYAGQQIKEEVLTDLGIKIGTGRVSRPRIIELKRTAQPVSVQDQGQGYRLDVESQKITISAATDDGIFYGVQTLKQLIRGNRVNRVAIPACTIIDWPKLHYRGWQHDISRGPIPTLAFLKKEIRLLSEFKLNLFTLYTEHVFKLKKHPTIAPADGITADEIKVLCAYGRKYHVEVVGNFQSFGHFTNILKVPGYRQLGENSDVISPAKEASYRFLNDVYSEIAPAYDSHLFTINCDEVSGLGDGPSKDLVKKLGVAGVYAKHINRIASLLRPYGKTAMMWGDIALNYPAIVPQLPKDLIVLPWAYDPRPSFQNQIEPFTKYGLRFMVCPGVSCWSQIWPDTQSASVNISNFIRDGARLGAMGALNTSWDDDGQNLYNDNWYEFAWGGECSWSPVKLVSGTAPDKVTANRVRVFNATFPAVFYGIQGDQVANAINDLSLLRTNPISGGLGNAALWRDPIQTLQSIPSTVSVEDFKSKAHAIRMIFETTPASASHSAETLKFAAFAAKEIEYLADVLLAVQSLQKGDDNAMEPIAKELQSLRNEYQVLWTLENRPYWLDGNLARFDRMIKTLRSFTHRVLIQSTIPGNGSAPISIRPISPGAEIYYTVDGSNPTSSSTRYTEPFLITKTGTVKAIGIWPGSMNSPIESQMVYVPVLPCTIHTNLNPYDDHSAIKAFDGDLNTFFWSSGNVYKGDFFEIQLATPREVSEIHVVTGHPDHQEDYLHYGAVEVSNGSEKYEKVADFHNGVAHASLSSKLISKIRLSVSGTQGNWLVIREIQIK